MNKGTAFQKIVRKSGMKPVNCKCHSCKLQCQAACLGLPEDMVALVEAGYADRLVRKEIDNDYTILKPMYDPAKMACTFFTDGLCELHDKGLKPTAGKLSHHTQTNTNPTKTIAYLVRKQWKIIDEKYVSKVIEAIKAVKRVER